MKSLLIVGAVLMGVATQSCLAAPVKGEPRSFKYSFAEANGEDDATVTEVRLVDNNQTIILQSDGTAVRYDLGHYSSGQKSDPKKANYRQGEANPNDFAMIVKVVNKEKFFAMKDFFPPIYATSTFATSVKKNGKTYQVSRGSYENSEFRQNLGEGSLALWTIERTILGVSSSIKWETDASLVRVRGIAQVKATPGKTSVDDIRVSVVVQSVKNANFKRITYARPDGTFQFLLPVGDYKLIARYYNPSVKATMRSAEQLVSVKGAETPRLSFLIDQIEPTIK